jgi:peptidoglycan/LPS O-acetylase OafA/YrhL
LSAAPAKLRNVQALRAIAALLVVGNHLPRDEGKLFGGGLLAGTGAAGATGVDLFFILSGFIMLVTTWNVFGQPGAARDFLIRRVLRIYPLWILVTLFALALNHVAPSALHLENNSPLDAVWSLLLIPHGVDPIVVVGWSLQFEMYFYLVFSAALLLVRDRLKLAIGLWIAVTLALQIAGALGGVWWLRFFGDPLAFEFMAGIGIGVLVMNRRYIRPEIFLAIGIVGAVVAIAYSARFSGFPTLPLAWFRVTCVGTFMAAIVYGAVALEARDGRIAPRWLVSLGDASYSMYLWHGYLLGALVIAFERLHPNGTLADLTFIAVAYIVVAAGSIAIYRLVEKPILKAFQRLGRMAPERTVVDSR